MADAGTDPLVRAYGNRIGTPSSDGEAYGYWVFVLGLVVGAVGIGLVLISDAASIERGAGIVLGAIALVLLLVGPTIRLPIRRSASYLSYLGAAVCLAAAVWFVVAYPEEFGADFTGQEVEIIGLYGLGVVVIALGSVLVPLATSLREERDAALDRADAAERERDAALADAETERAASAEQRSEHNQVVREAERRARTARQAREEAERAHERTQAQIDALRASQSQFELYTDRGGTHRWRLRHRNRNIIADSAQGYSSRRTAQQGLAAVRRDALGAPIVDLDIVAEDADVSAADEAVEGPAAPPLLATEDSRATIETYEDEGGEYRWRLVHDNGNVLADSGQGYASADGRDGAVERLRTHADTAQYLRIDPAAFEIYRDAAGKYRWRLLSKNGRILADSGQGYASRQKARQGAESVRTNAPEGGAASFETYEDEAGEYRWRLVHDNGNVIADSGQGYDGEGGAEDGVVRVREYAPETDLLQIGAAAFEVYEDAAGKYRWRLRHRNGNVLADSGQGYADRRGAIEGIHGVKRNAPGAERTAA